MYAEKLADLLNEQWKVKSSPDEVDWPDLLVTAGSEMFGLEVRELYPDEGKKGSGIKAKERMNLRRLQKLADAYYKKVCIPVKVDLLGDIDDIARHNKILSVLIQEAPKLALMEQKIIQPYCGCMIYLRRLPNHLKEYRRWNYISDKVGWVREIDKKKIEQAIAIKAKNIPKYQKNLSDIWLLIVSDRICNSGKDRIENKFTCNCRDFKKIYYLSYPVEAWCIGS